MSQKVSSSFAAKVYIFALFAMIRSAFDYDTLMSLGRSYAPRNIRATPTSIQNIVYLVIGLFITGILGPPAISAISTANTSGWQSSVVTVFEVLLPVLAVLAVALYFFHEIA